jgi:hypothetical protein
MHFVCSSPESNRLPSGQVQCALQPQQDAPLLTTYLQSYLVFLLAYLFCFCAGKHVLDEVLG